MVVDVLFVDVRADYLCVFAFQKTLSQLAPDAGIDQQAVFGFLRVLDVVRALGKRAYDAPAF